MRSERSASGRHPRSTARKSRASYRSVRGWPLQGAIKTLERKLADGTFTHADQALLGYAIGNAKTEIKGNAVMITKQLAGASKIDPLMAAFDAVALMSKNPTPLYQSTPWDDDPEYRMTA